MVTATGSASADSVARAIAAAHHRGVRCVVDQGAQHVPVAVDGLQHAKLGVDGVVVVARLRVGSELAVHQVLAGRGGAGDVAAAGRIGHRRHVAAHQQLRGHAVRVRGVERLHRLVVHVLEIVDRNSAPQADEVGTGVAVVAVDHDHVDGHAGVVRHLLTDVPDAAGALLVGGEGALVLQRAEQHGVAMLVADRHGARVDVLCGAVAVDQRTRAHPGGEEPVAPEVEVAAEQVAGTGIERLLGEADPPGQVLARRATRVAAARG
jgi:hypothetical protein